MGIKNGKIICKAGGKTSGLTTSTFDIFPAEEGWMMFAYKKWTFYILLQTTGVRVYGIHCRKIFKATASIQSGGDGKPKGKGKDKGKKSKKGKAKKSKGKAKKSKGKDKGKKSKGKDKGKKSKKGKAKKSKGKAKKSKGKDKGKKSKSK